jgi:hypothetical protein
MPSSPDQNEQLSAHEAEEDEEEEPYFDDDEEEGADIPDIGEEQLEELKEHQEILT